VVHFEQGIDMSLGGGETQSPVADSNKYAQIMELMRLRQAMTPQSYTGGFNAPSSGSASASPQSYYDEILRLQALNNFNRNLRDGGRGDPGFSSNPGWDALDDAGKASYYSQNPTMGKITQLGQNLFGYTTLGMLQKALDPTFVSNQSLIAQGIDPSIAGMAEAEGFALGPAATSTSASDVSNAAISGMAEAEGFALGPAATSTTGQSIGDMAEAEGFGLGPAATGGGGGNDGVGGGFGGNDGSGAGFGGIYSRGGYVNKMDLKGPNPMGPDDGYGGLDDGEYVINAKSVGKYGIELMNAINAGKISKGKLRGLLEA
jgi:hypothetical protein